ncbi:MAG TPA: Eco57I restriction-modification methylase domain-containing protein [Phycisphaerae bacterium]|nr:Eco57I restriction-modification methylase domain-containing protein [Phycisphaerae bacterium]HRR84058.1 Eco57I restriction-modification methylase domain-containing protein [Phycisphaerae bacterium]
MAAKPVAELIATKPQTHPCRDEAGVNPLAVAETARREVNASLDRTRRSALGQFFTPPATAQFMASMCSVVQPQVHLLDAGAGLGALTAAWVNQICSRSSRPSSVRLTAYEVDTTLLPALRQTMSACRQACEAAGIACEWVIHEADFIEAAVERLAPGLFRAEDHPFTVAILNPPYKKFHADSRTRRLLRQMNIETTNLYAAFLALALLSLEVGGELVAITPRSFCNGPYFRPFRQHLFRHASLTHVHVFEARDHAFRDDEVLQENVIIRAVKGVSQQPTVSVSQSETPDDLIDTQREVGFDRVVRPGDHQAFIHLVPDGQGDHLADAMVSLPCTLDDLGISVSTGRVVEFRARQWLRAEPAADTVPLIYPTHFDAGVVRWPKAETKKPNAIVCNSESASLMVRAGVYVLVKRFSAKEERRRLVAAIFDREHVPCEMVGFENHLNYFHERGAPLGRELAKGLWAFLNSSALDSYFRQFNGHTQVNATDLRSLHYPSRESLVTLGGQLKGFEFTQGVLDAAVKDILRVG